MASVHEAGEAVRRGDFAGAEQHCRQALDENFNDPWALNLLAMLQARAGRLNEARATQVLAVSINPDDAGFLSNLAKLDYATGDVEAARQHVRDSLTLDPHNPSALGMAARLMDV